MRQILQFLLRHLNLLQCQKLSGEISGEMRYCLTTGSESFAGYFNFYDGNQTKPNPTIDMALGGNSPIYRGHSYSVFKDVPLAMFGNRIPIELEFYLILPSGGYGADVSRKL